jgi:hypothetical protein
MQFECLGAVSVSSTLETGLYIDQRGNLRMNSGIMTGVSELFIGIGSPIGALNRVALFVDPDERFI